MSHKASWIFLFIILAFLGTTAAAFAASKEKVLYDFKYGGAAGYQPEAGLIFDSAGNLYGTAADGDDGSYSGTVFDLTPAGNGQWTEKVLYSFCSVHGCTDGYDPEAGLVFDAAGNLYGTTLNGGSNCVESNYGCGTVFELVPGTSGTWTEKVLYNFCGEGYGDCTDGSVPKAGLILDASGNLYGTTAAGGDYSPYCLHQCGTVFKLTPQPDGTWAETVLYSFQGGTDGYYPVAGLTFDPAGNLYGTTRAGGVYGYGTLFKLSLRKNGQWRETVLHSFAENGKDGSLPEAALIYASGKLYGTTSAGGAHASSCGGSGCGTVFELAPQGKGTWRERILYTFSDSHGSGPSGLVFDLSSNLYGATYGGGNSRCACGVVFELTPSTKGSWTEKNLHTFGRGNDGKYPSPGSLVFDTAGNLYGTTEQGGSGTGGTVFEITP